VVEVEDGVRRGEEVAERACEAFDCGSLFGGGFVVVKPCGDVYGILLEYRWDVEYLPERRDEVVEIVLCCSLAQLYGRMVYRSEDDVYCFDIRKRLQLRQFKLKMR
jgi:hypothetical protein